MESNVQDRRNGGQRNMSQVNFRNVEHQHQSSGEPCREEGSVQVKEGGGGHKMRHLYAGKTSENITRQTLARDEGEEHLDNTRCPREQGKVSHQLTLPHKTSHYQLTDTRLYKRKTAVGVGDPATQLAKVCNFVRKIMLRIRILTLGPKNGRVDFCRSW